MALSIAALPELLFYDGQRRTRRFSASAEAGKIAWLAERLAEVSGPRIGLVFRTSPDLVLMWLAALKAGKHPLILQYPTEKLSRDYWRDSIKHTVETCRLDAVVHDPAVAIDVQQVVPVTVEFDGECETSTPDGRDITEATVLQLSSGTTGHRKGIEFSLDQLELHTRKFNETLNLGTGDRIVSWLPLYHDMGFIACFVMPLMLGIPVVMIDPITWIKDPGLLFRAIAQHGATHCYQPNFAFELLSRVDSAGNLDSVRFISCSEPTYRASLERFSGAHGISPKNISICYAMAENVFAVSLSDGMKERELDGVPVMSCGRPISGTEVRTKDGELFVRSAHAVTRYLADRGTGGGADVRDADGFYATGDLGAIVDGEVLVTGRKRDLLVSAGRKYLLNDLDVFLNRLFPESAGRVCALADDNVAAGTQLPVFVIEDSRFWRADRRRAAEEKIRAQSEFAACEVHLVPPRFLTKTSSGKLNRKKIIEDLRAAQSGEAGPRSSRPLEDEIAALFPTIRRDIPINQALDSLGLIVLQLSFEEAARPFDPRQPLATLLDGAPAANQDHDEAIYIVSLADGRLFTWLDDSVLDELSRALGRPVLFETLAVPPAPILLSDIVFHDWFLPRRPDDAYASFRLQVEKIKRASLLVLDDTAEFFMPRVCNAYSRISHRFERMPEADLMAVRYAGYTRGNHLMPMEVVWASEIDEPSIVAAIPELGQYLGVPLFRIATSDTFAAHTQDFEYRELHGAGHLNPVVDRERLTAALIEKLRTAPLRLTQQRGQRRLKRDEGGYHLCSFWIDENVLERIIAHYDTFLLAGLPSSLPRFRQRLDALGKRYEFFTAGQHLPDSNFECIVSVGLWPTSALDDSGRPVFYVLEGLPGGTLLSKNVPEPMATSFRHLYPVPLRVVDAASGKELPLARVMEASKSRRLLAIGEVTPRLIERLRSMNIEPLVLEGGASNLIGVTVLANPRADVLAELPVILSSAGWREALPLLRTMGMRSIYIPINL